MVREKIRVRVEFISNGVREKLELGLNEFQVEVMEKIIVRIRIGLISNKD